MLTQRLGSLVRLLALPLVLPRKFVLVLLTCVDMIQFAVIGEPTFDNSGGAHLDIVELRIEYFAQDFDVIVDAYGEYLLEDVNGRGAKPTISLKIPCVDLFLEGVGRIPDWEVFLHCIITQPINNLSLLFKYCFAKLG